MPQIHEDDVILAFRQSVEDELKRLQNAETTEPVFVDEDSNTQNLRRLAKSHAQLQSEVALLRTIILKLMSQPLDETQS